MEWLELHRKTPTPNVNHELAQKCQMLSKFLPEPVKAHEFLTKLSNHMQSDPNLLKEMETIVRPNVSCKECTYTTAIVLKKLGQPVMTNLYYNTVKMLLERVSSVMVDHEAVKILIKMVQECFDGGNIIDEIGLNPATAGDRGLKLLVVSFHNFHSSS